MKLEDNIRRSLFWKKTRLVEGNIKDDEAVIECKAQRGKPIPLCMPTECYSHADVAYRQLYTSMYSGFRERSSPRAMFNAIFDRYTNHPLERLKIKDIRYYSATGALFDENLNPLFYFAWDIRDQQCKPVLFLTPTLLVNSSMSGKPMEKFFMSTIVPFLINNSVNTRYGDDMVTIEMDNHPDDTFFVPVNTLVSTTPVDKTNDKLNDILADNADQLSVFINNYEGML